MRLPSKMAGLSQNLGRIGLRLEEYQKATQRYDYEQDGDRDQDDDRENQEDVAPEDVDNVYGAVVQLQGQVGDALAQLEGRVPCGGDTLLKMAMLAPNGVGKTTVINNVLRLGECDDATYHKAVQKVRADLDASHAMIVAKSLIADNDGQGLAAAQQPTVHYLSELAGSSVPNGRSAAEIMEGLMKKEEEAREALMRRAFGIGKRIGKVASYVLPAREVGKTTTNKEIQVVYGPTWQLLVRYKSREQVYSEFEESDWTRPDHELKEGERITRDSMKVVAAALGVDPSNNMATSAGQAPTNQELAAILGTCHVYIGSTGDKVRDRILVREELESLLFKRNPKTGMATTDINDRAYVVDSVCLFAPCSFLKVGLMLIDTPGTNDANAFKAMTTNRVVEQAGALVMLVQRELGAHNDVLQAMHRCGVFRRLLDPNEADFRVICLVVLEKDSNRAQNLWEITEEEDQETYAAEENERTDPVLESFKTELSKAYKEANQDANTGFSEEEVRNAVQTAMERVSVSCMWPTLHLSLALLTRDIAFKKNQSIMQGGNDESDNGRLIDADLVKIAMERTNGGWFLAQLEGLVAQAVKGMAEPIKTTVATAKTALLTRIEDRVQLDELSKGVFKQAAQQGARLHRSRSKHYGTHKQTAEALLDPLTNGTPEQRSVGRQLRRTIEDVTKNEAGREIYSLVHPYMAGLKAQPNRPPWRSLMAKINKLSNDEVSTLFDAASGGAVGNVSLPEHLNSVLLQPLLKCNGSILEGPVRRHGIAFCYGVAQFVRNFVIQQLLTLKQTGVNTRQGAQHQTDSMPIFLKDQLDAHYGPELVNEEGRKLITADLLEKKGLIERPKWPKFVQSLHTYCKPLWSLLTKTATLDLRSDISHAVTRKLLLAMRGGMLNNPSRADKIKAFEGLLAAVPDYLRSELMTQVRKRWLDGLRKTLDMLGITQVPNDRIFHNYIVMDYRSFCNSLKPAHEAQIQLMRSLSDDLEGIEKELGGVLEGLGTEDVNVRGEAINQDLRLRSVRQWFHSTVSRDGLTFTTHTHGLLIDSMHGLEQVQLQVNSEELTSSDLLKIMRECCQLSHCIKEKDLSMAYIPQKGSEAEPSEKFRLAMVLLYAIGAGKVAGTPHRNLHAQERAKIVKPLLEALDWITGVAPKPTDGPTSNPSSPDYLSLLRAFCAVFNTNINLHLCTAHTGTHSNCPIYPIIGNPETNSTHLIGYAKGAGFVALKANLVQKRKHEDIGSPKNGGRKDRQKRARMSSSPDVADTEVRREAV